MITHYEVLGVKENASSREIKKAHIKLAVCLHPDKNVGVNETVQRLVEERFLEVQEAYETLSNDARRKEYDEALAALRSEGEYYIPTAPKPAAEPAAPKTSVKRKGPPRCDKCQTVVGEPMHYVCEDCRKEIAVLEREVKARRQLGVTACKLCGASKQRVDGLSPLSGVCLKCWGNIANQVKKECADKRLVQCPQCGRMRPAGGYCEVCRQKSVTGGSYWSWKQSVADIRRPVAGWAVVYLALSLATGYWEAQLFVTLVFLVVHVYIKKMAQ